MKNKDEALRLALEVLEDLGMKHYENTGEVLYKNTYTAIKSALEAKDERVVNTDHVICPNCVHQFRAIPQNVQKLMLASGFEPPFTTPPQRTWAGLTDEDIEQEFGFIDELLRDCVQRTEAKLKEKNQ